MDDQTSQATSAAQLPSNAALRRWRSLNKISAKTEALVWVFLLLTVVAIRAYLVHLIPVCLWSDDATSYATSAFHWVHTGIWSTDARRGPIYSLLIAACSKAAGNLDSVMLAQHCMGGIAVFLAMVALRFLYGRSLLLPIALCSYAYAVYGLPIYLEHLIRNETLLFFFSSVAFVSWLAAIRFEKPHLLWISGIAAGLLMCTKSVFGPFPVIVVLGALWYWRSTPKVAAKFALVFAVAFLLPIFGVKALKKITHDTKAPQPQAGILLYARTTQFTYLDGGIAPEIKKEIRPEVEDYMRDYHSPHRQYNNNTIIYKTVVPHLKTIFSHEGKLPADVNKLCQQLAIEAILHHPFEYAKQVLHDLERIHLKGGFRLDSPKPKDLTANIEKLQAMEKPDPLMRIDHSVSELQTRTESDHFKTFHRLTKSAWLFLFAPVLWTTLLLPFFLLKTQGKTQLFWWGAAGVWYFTMVLLATVGRPLDRYLIPAVPVMFLTLSSAFILLWERVGMLIEGKAKSAPTAQHCSA